MGGGEDHVAHDVVGLELGAADTATAATLRLERRGRHRLDVLRLGHDDDELFVVDEVLDRHLAVVIGELAHAGLGELLLDRQQLVLDDLAQLGVVGEDRLELLDARANVGELGLEVDPAEARQLAELHVEDVDRLHLGELVRRDHQRRLGRGRVVARPDEGDDLVDHVERLDPALEDVLAAACLVEPELGAPGDDLDLVADVAGERRGEVERARHTVDEGDHVDRERRLQLRQLEQVVEHDIGVGVALECDHEVGLAAGRSVVDVGDALEVAGGDELLDATGDRRAARLVRQLGDDDLVATVLALLDRRLGAHLHAAAAGAVGVDDAGPPEDLTAGREVGPLHELHQLIGGGDGVVHQSGWSIRWIVASITSPRLWGGMLVAMPTAMPWLPLTSRFGKRAGSTVGSSLDPS